MKTALQELINEMKDHSYKVSKEGNLDMVAAFDYAIGIAKKYKEKEKEQIEIAFDLGRDEVTSVFIIDGEDYYNKSFNQNK
jgi:hypothetical protein